MGATCERDVIGRKELLQDERLESLQVLGREEKTPDMGHIQRFGDFFCFFGETEGVGRGFWRGLTVLGDSWVHGVLGFKGLDLWEHF